MSSARRGRHSARTAADPDVLLRSDSLSSVEGKTVETGARLSMGRWAAALLVLAACLFYAVLASFAFGTYYLSDVGAGRLREQAVGLTFACGAGLGGVVAFRALTERRVLSPWLLIGLVPPVIGALNHLGVIR